MLAGEAGADYVMFGEPDADGPPAVACTQSWSGLRGGRNCSKFRASPMRSDSTKSRELCAAGADFIAIGDAVFADPQRMRAAHRRTRGVGLPA